MTDLKKLPIDVTEYMLKYIKFLECVWPFYNDLNTHQFDYRFVLSEVFYDALWNLFVDRLILGKDIASHPELKKQYSIVAKWNLPIKDVLKHQIVPQEKQWRVFAFSGIFKNSDPQALSYSPPFVVVNIGVRNPKTASYSCVNVAVKDVRFFLEKTEQNPS